MAGKVRSSLASEAAALVAKHIPVTENSTSPPRRRPGIESYIDLLIEFPDGLIIGDWKTDTVSWEADVDTKLATHELQSASYAVTIESATGEPEIDVRFAFCRPAGAIERRTTDLTGAKARVRRELLPEIAEM